MKFTVCIATRDDPGTWSAINALWLNQGDLIERMVIVDNSRAGSTDAVDLQKHCASNPLISYYRYVNDPSSCLYKEAAIRHVDDENAIVLLCDSHVLFPQGALEAAGAWVARHEQDLVVGPVHHNSWTKQHMASHQMLYADEGTRLPNGAQVRHGVVCRGEALGAWSLDPRCVSGGAPFEVMQQGTGALVFMRKAWPGFHPCMTGFGGNETYLMESFRHRGGRVMCVPDFRWVHDFANRDRHKYARPRELTIRNYLVGFLALQRAGHPRGQQLYDAALEHFTALDEAATKAAVKRAPREIDVKFTHAPVNSKQAEKGTGVYEKFIGPWTAAGGDASGACPRGLFVWICHQPSTIVDRPTRTLEFGCGLSTLGFDRQRTQHKAIESDATWIKRVQSQLTGDRVEIVHAPLREDGFYDWEPKWGDLYDVILIDGPFAGKPDVAHRRRGALALVPKLLAKAGRVIVDDTHRPAELELAKELAQILGLERAHYVEGGRAYDLLLPKVTSLEPGPGAELQAFYDWLGMPACQRCFDTARRMNELGVAGCRAQLEVLVEDILPRARDAWKNKMAWMSLDKWFKAQPGLWKTLKAQVNPEPFLRESVTQHITDAITRAETGRPFNPAAVKAAKRN